MILRSVGSVQFCQHYQTKCPYCDSTLDEYDFTEKNSFVTATKLGTTNNFLVAATQNFAAATKHFVDRAKHFVAVTKYFCYPYFNK